MSRIRGIEAIGQKDVSTRPARRNGASNAATAKNKIEDVSKEDAEKQQIRSLSAALPALDALLELTRKIGEGTFSSVYLGYPRAHAALPPARRRWLAVKHLVPTAHPARVEHELRCLQDMGGKDNVIGVDLCLRHLDTIVFIMPYLPHKKFSEYVGVMDAGELREYLRALLVALRRVHSFGVIHRDVKPSNFLYDRDNKRYLLVDFGLAQRIGCAPPSPGDEPLSPGDAPPSPGDAPPSPGDAPPSPGDAPGLDTRPSGTRVSLPAPLSEHHASLKRPRELEPSPPEAPAAKRVAWEPPAAARGPRGPLPVEGYQLPKGAGAACACWGVGAVCGGCAARGAARACRAGTGGFRPPEVLLKCPRQGTAVDMWAVGVVLASVLSARYPFFRAGDDAAALAELADLLGTQPLQRAAEALGRRLLLSRARRGLCLRRLCARLRAPPPPPPPPAPHPAPAAPRCPHCRVPQSQCLCRDPDTPAESFTAGRRVAGFPDSAFALAARLLAPDPRHRITAAQALQHPFLTARD